jgi:hypothetical protein
VKIGDLIQNVEYGTDRGTGRFGVVVRIAINDQREKYCVQWQSGDVSWARTGFLAKVVSDENR